MTIFFMEPVYANALHPAVGVSGYKTKTVMLTLGVVGAVIAPVLAAIGASAALVTDCKIEVERMERK
jgi:hypothetical protein